MNYTNTLLMAREQLIVDSLKGITKEKMDAFCMAFYNKFNTEDEAEFISYYEHDDFWEIMLYNNDTEFMYVFAQAKFPGTNIEISQFEIINDESSEDYIRKRFVQDGAYKNKPYSVYQKI